jgi:hypothetical protein
MPGDYKLTYDALDAELTKHIPRRLWIQGIDYGKTTGVCLMSIPRASIFGNAPRSILSRHTWELTGSMRMQIRHITSIALRVSMPTSPCLMVCEDFDLGGNRLTGAGSEADVVASLRGGAALQHAVECGHAGNAVLVYQGRTLAFTTAKDERLKAWGMWDVGSDHKRDATRHAITMVRRISSGSVLASDIWEDDEVDTR